VFYNGCFNIRAVGSLRTVLVYKRYIIILAIIVGGYRLVEEFKDSVVVIFD
jgi:hypothetical protein